MIIYNIPNKFQPIYKSTYPQYSSGKNIEEIYFELFKSDKNDIQSNYIYLPIFWTSIYNIRSSEGNFDDLYDWLNKLDKTKKYFTIVQWAAGIFVKNLNIPLLIFSAGGGGKNIKDSSSIIQKNYYGYTRNLFIGKKGDYDLPLICLPEFPQIEVEKDISISFMGRLDTHPCRIELYNKFHNSNFIKFFKSQNFSQYKIILNRSIFTLAPRGYGYTSFRIYEAIMANSIPIYIWYDKIILPFSDEINWNDFCIIINSKDIDKLPQIIEKTDKKKMLSNLLEIKYKFTFNESFKYIIRKLSKLNN